MDGLYEKMSSVKRVTLQVPGRVVTVAGLYVKVSSVKRVMYRYLDESLRWLVANDRKEAAVRVLERAARVNRQDLTVVLKTLDWARNDEGNCAFPSFFRCTRPFGMLALTSVTSYCTF